MSNNIATIERVKIYNRRPVRVAWNYGYIVRHLDLQYPSGRSQIGETRRWCKKRFGADVEIVETWK